MAIDVCGTQWGLVGLGGTQNSVELKTWWDSVELSGAQHSVGLGVAQWDLVGLDGTRWDSVGLSRTQ